MLSIAQEYGIPAVIVFTYTQYEAGEEFVNAAKDELNNSFKHFLKDRFIRVNSQNYQIMNTEVKTSGLENLLEATVSCLGVIVKSGVWHSGRFLCWLLVFLLAIFEDDVVDHQGQQVESLNPAPAFLGRFQ